MNMMRKFFLNIMARKRKAINLNFCEFDFSKIKDSKGGFIAEAKEETQKVANTKGNCAECNSIDIDQNYLKYYGVLVCNNCKSKDCYALLTKTEARQDYLLVENEFKELKPWIKKNPHKSTYNNMLLYLKRDVEDFAIKKWGSLEDMDQEFYSREEKKKQRKALKFEKDMKELRKKTRISRDLLVSTTGNCVQHNYYEKDGFQICKICKFQIEFEEL